MYYPLPFYFLYHLERYAMMFIFQILAVLNMGLANPDQTNGSFNFCICFCQWTVQDALNEDSRNYTGDNIGIICQQGKLQLAYGACPSFLFAVLGSAIVNGLIYIKVVRVKGRLDKSTFQVKVLSFNVYQFLQPAEIFSSPLKTKCSTLQFSKISLYNGAPTPLLKGSRSQRVPGRPQPLGQSNNGKGPFNKMATCPRCRQWLTGLEQKWMVRWFQERHISPRPDPERGSLVGKAGGSRDLCMNSTCPRQLWQHGCAGGGRSAVAVSRELLQIPPALSAVAGRGCEHWPGFGNHPRVPPAALVAARGDQGGERLACNSVKPSSLQPLCLFCFFTLLYHCIHLIPLPWFSIKLSNSIASGWQLGHQA